MVELKDKLLLAQAQLESGEADMLVRFNVQIYPVGEGNEDFSRDS